LDGHRSESLYQRALSRGIHIVCSNVHSCAYLSSAVTSKLPVPISLKKLPSTTLYPGLLQCDACVGTSLPILDALRRIVKTGDVPLKVEASLSGSMGFVCDRLNHGASLKEAVLEAFNSNYMEANPWDDLRGRDVERKFRVIAFCLGMLELDNAQLSAEGLVPAWLEEKYSWETTGIAGLAAAMEEYEPQFKELHQHLGCRGRRLRFVATMGFSYKCLCDARNPQAADPVARAGSRFSSLYDVKMQAGCAFVPRDHPLYSLSGTQISVALTTERYRHPLILKGSGAGFAEGAAGLLNEMITVAHALKGW
jgi:aspartokinase/homoserine dehydrogenase 1